MKGLKIIVAVVFLVVVQGVSAQTFLGFQAGYINTYADSENKSTGFNLGPLVEQPLGPNLDLQLGAFYSCISRQWDGGVSDLLGFTAGTNMYKGHFVGIPLWLKINFSDNTDMRLFAFGGPRLNFGFSQKVKNVTQVSESETVINNYSVYDVDLNNDNVKDMAHYELLGGAGLGVQAQAVQVKFGYEWGLKDLNNMGNIVLKRDQFTISLTYIFQTD